MATFGGMVTIKRYADQRLYDGAAARYVSLDRLADMVEDGEDFVVFDAKTGDDVTHWALKQIIIERSGHG